MTGPRSCHTNLTFNGCFYLKYSKNVLYMQLINGSEVLGMKHTIVAPYVESCSNLKKSLTID